MKRHILKELRLDEISAVDRPAQAHALIGIMKQREASDAPLTTAEVDSAIVTVAKASFPDLEEPQAVAELLRTETGAQLYALRSAAE